jgi:hypothetical protein
LNLFEPQVTIPWSVVLLEPCSFAQCSKLMNIVVPNPNCHVHNGTFMFSGKCWQWVFKGEHQPFTTASSS